MKPKIGKTDFDTALAVKAEYINGILASLLDEFDNIPDQLASAISYTLCAPGKRIRPAIVLWCCELVNGGTNSNAEIAASAVEMMHTSSLIHDDLPAMDNDDFRRGRESCHKAFDEATAILTGDGLIMMAFEILARKIDRPETAVKMITTLARAAGTEGMIAGQSADLQAENCSGDAERVDYIHLNKTAKMFGASAKMGGIAGGADEGQLNSLERFGLKLGLGFQAADDLLDISATSQHLGKAAGKDAERGKMTYPGVLGLEKARKIAQSLADEAIEALTGFGQKADILRTLTFAMLERTR